MIAFSANLGFLWTDRSLPEAIKAAANAGFDAVECHYPYEFPAADVKAALTETGLTMLGLNTARGDITAGDNGLAAVPGRQVEAREKIDQAITYAVAIGTANVHVMAGKAAGDEALSIYIENLRYAAGLATEHGLTILIEPLNHYDAPGYFLKTTGQAADVIKAVGGGNIKLMFDCYHVQISEGDLCRRFENLQSMIGHVQIASVPDRAEPDHGEVNYPYVIKHMMKLGYDRPIGAEYRPTGTVEGGLGWLRQFKAI